MAQEQPPKPRMSPRFVPSRFMRGRRPHLSEALAQIGEFVPESEAFDELYDTMTDALSSRRSEGEAAKKICERGYQKLTKDLPYEAIRWFGKAVSMLVKEEYEDELINALIGSSFAYEEAGLPWAARNYSLAAVSQQFATFHRLGSLDSVNPAVLQRFFWTEFRLGRIPHILSAHELEMAARSARARTDEHRERLERAQISRIQRMYSSRSNNLESFLEAFQQPGRFFLVPAHFPTRKSQPEPLMEFGLGKYHLVVRDAWEIGAHDPDGIVLDPNDPPVIPSDQPNAPVLKALARMAQIKPEQVGLRRRKPK